MRVAHIGVTKLFRLFDHSIPLNIEDRTTIIHGPNGYGKTVLLTLIDAFFNLRYPTLARVPYAEFSVSFDDGNTVKVTKLDRPASDPRKLSPLNFTMTDA